MENKEQNKCNCQYEEGHSFVCPLYEEESFSKFLEHQETKLPECRSNCKNAQERGFGFVYKGKCLDCGKSSPQKEEPKESFEERTAKKLDNDILDKISDEAKQEDF